LPKGCGYIQRECDQLRTVIETVTADAHEGQISVLQAALIQTAIRWERHASLAQRWLRLECAQLTPDQRLAYSRDIARASAERDKCLLQLGLDQRADKDVWATFDRQREVLPPTASSRAPVADPAHEPAPSAASGRSAARTALPTSAAAPRSPDEAATDYRP
jgi:hypothetical protein